MYMFNPDSIVANIKRLTIFFGEVSGPSSRKPLIMSDLPAYLLGRLPLGAWAPKFVTE